MKKLGRCIMGFAGHMIDDPMRKTPRFPPEAEPGVRSAIHECLDRYKPEIAVSSAACGGDIIFAEEVIKLGIPICIILPFEDEEEFVGRSVSFPEDGERWAKRFNNVIKKAKHVFSVNPRGYRCDIDFEENQHAIVFFSLGMQEILKIKIQIVNIILYDEQATDGESLGGTKSFLELCEHLEKTNLHLLHEIIPMAQIRNQSY